MHKFQEVTKSYTQREYAGAICDFCHIDDDDTTLTLKVILQEGEEGHAVWDLTFHDDCWVGPAQIGEKLEALGLRCIDRGSVHFLQCATADDAVSHSGLYLETVDEDDTW